jgi:2-C-methyl-D-erythritol 4-phosphate cytidylyltransferase
MKKNLTIILAGGSGARLNKETPKQFLELAGRPIISYTIEKFETHPAVDHIFIVTNAEYLEQTVTLIEKNGFKKVKKVLKGGATRQESSYRGLMAGTEEYENVLIHDAVRPFITRDIIAELILKLSCFAAVVPGIPSADTIIKIDKEQLVEDIPDRNFLRRVQTPQAFKFSLIKKAHQLALTSNTQNAGDDCSLILKFKTADICFIPGSRENIKITYPQDLILAEEIIKKRND